tara:strand:+ start:645 stop:1565 length:921 start_codon:yes stop_codon:yes gene_type:complete
MRNTFSRELLHLAKKDKNIILLSGDIGNRMFDELKKNCPNQFLNCGIAEANMMSMAAGMALCGARPVIYTITPFTTLRCFEQIKISVSYQQAPVVIVGTGSGLSYAELGPTHHSLEDIAILKTIPDINILAPSDSIELASFLKQSLSLSKPTYIRIGKKGEPDLNPKGFNPKIGKANYLKEGKDIILFGVGPILSEALEAALILKDKGIDMAVVSMGSVRPLDSQFLHSVKQKKFKYWLTLEEHGIEGGFGSSILEWIYSNKLNKEINLKRIAIPNKFINRLGNQSYLRDQLNINANGISQFVINL